MSEADKRAVLSSRRAGAGCIYLAGLVMSPRRGGSRGAAWVSLTQGLIGGDFHDRS
jgi:hypothetical protein